MELEPGFKLTEAGVIPVDWEAKPIVKILDRGRLGGNYPNQDIETNHPLIKMGNIGRGQIDTGKVQYISPNIVPDPLDRLQFGDLLFNTRNTLELVGKVAIWRDEMPVAYYNSNLMRLEFKPQEICSNAYANSAFNSHGSVSRLRAIATGTTSVAAIYTRDLLQLQFPVPPNTEQIAIADALTDVDAHISQLDRLIVKKRDTKQGAMQILLTGKQRLPGFADEWQSKSFGDLAGPRKARVNPRRLGTADFCIEMDNIEQETGRLLGSTIINNQSSLKSIFEPGDVLFGKLRAYLRKYWLADCHGVCSTEIWPLMPNLHLMNSRYLFQIVKTDWFIEIASNAYGTHMPRSDWNVVKNYVFAVPSLEEQAAIASILSDMDAEIIALEQKREKICALKQGMMQELLTGRTRLV